MPPCSHACCSAHTILPPPHSHHACHHLLAFCILQVDDDGSGLVEFDEFVKCIEKNKAASQRNADDGDTVDAFVAMGGNVSNTSCSNKPGVMQC